MIMALLLFIASYMYIMVLGFQKEHHAEIKVDSHGLGPG